MDTVPQHLYHCPVEEWLCLDELGDTKCVIRIRTSKKNRQHNEQKKSTKDKLRSTKHIHKAKDRETRTPLKIEGELRSPGYHS